LLLVSLTLAAACSTGPTPKGARPVAFGASAEPGKVMTQIELQETLQRFCDTFLTRISEGTRQLDNIKRPELRYSAMFQTLLYASSAMEIATEPMPELALLDMLVFMTLNRETVESYWIPNVFGAAGKPFSDAFNRSEQDIWAISDRVMTSAQQTKVKELIEEWRRKHPEQYRVETVRLSDFAQAAEKVVQSEESESGGILGSVAAVVERADQALLMANRGLYLAQRMPFLFRLQGRILATEVFKDLGALFPLAEAGSLADKAEAAAAKGTGLAKSLYPLIPPPGELARALASTDRITDKTLRLVSALESAGPAQRLEQLARTLMLYVLILAVGLSLVLWGGLYSYKRALARAAARDRLKREHEPGRHKAA
jgi:hypothetical protein